MPSARVPEALLSLRRDLESSSEIFNRGGAHHQRLGILTSLAAVLRFLSTISPPLPTGPLQSCLIVLTDVESQARPALLETANFGRPVACSETHELRGTLAAAVTFLIGPPAAGITEDEACSFVAREAEKCGLRPRGGKVLSGPNIKTMRKEVLRTPRTKKGIRADRPNELQAFLIKAAQDRLGRALHDEVLIALRGGGAPVSREKRMDMVRALVRGYQPVGGRRVG